MLSLFKKDPSKALEKRYAQLLEEAMQFQRKGDIKNYSQKTQEANDLLKKIDQLKTDI